MAMWRLAKLPVLAAESCVKARCDKLLSMLPLTVVTGAFPRRFALCSVMALCWHACAIKILAVEPANDKPQRSQMQCSRKQSTHMPY